MAGASAKLPPDDRHEGTLRTGSMVSAYRIERLLGTGGMGWVYRAMHVIEAKYVALKVLREDQLRQDRAIDRMMREAQILATVPHPGIPTFFECGLLPDGRPWIAMELIEGTPLSVRIAEGALDHEQVLGILGDVAAVLAAAHQRGVTHRDLKPDNILLTPTDPSHPLRVIDWGIAHHVAGARYTHHDEAIGTPTYMAPEQARGGPSEGHCDVYGLGVVAYQALAGRPPFVGKTSVEILVQHLNKPVPPLAPRCPEAPIGLIELVESMLIKNYCDRPTAEEVLESVATLRSLDDHRAVPTYMTWSDEGTAPRPRIALDDECALELIVPIAAGTPDPDGPKVDFGALENALDAPTTREIPKRPRTHELTPSTTPLRPSLIRSDD
ncbi:MAG TPA: serine/threonine-protein kinase [Kofleriaceae bacterium]|nr:serine/threonine-protein kinase [Kofleriaceae bacterium]